MISLTRADTQSAVHCQSTWSCCLNKAIRDTLVSCKGAPYTLLTRTMGFLLENAAKLTHGAVGASRTMQSWAQPQRGGAQPSSSPLGRFGELLAPIPSRNLPSSSGALWQRNSLVLQLPLVKAGELPRLPAQRQASTPTPGSPPE